MSEDSGNIQERDNTWKRFIIALARYTLKRHFKTDKVLTEAMPEIHFRATFANGVVWICYPEGTAANKLFANATEVLVFFRCSLINTDISRSSYEIQFTNLNGEVIFRSIETVSPLKIIEEE
ncbi:MAG: hypothetical protein N3B13_08840 [Deltaproteobacteria bacterium]|nr:hypothetical protein [Deltaproteobacteria bacterium]